VPTFTLEQSGPCAFITVAGMQFSVKLVDATFPPYQQVIPASVATKVRVPRLALIDAVKAIQIAASDRTGGIKLTLVKGALRITSESPESGNAFDEVPVDYAGAEITIGFNAKYLLDVLSILIDDEVELGFGGELDPMMITPPSNDDTANYTAVVMPLRL
jgi:DNA polymerase-3 subunit beta